MAQHVPIYLCLPVELGGTRFGPFTKRVDIGSDGKLNQLVLDSRHGIFPQHAVGVQSETGVLTLQPTGPQAQLFVIPNGQAHVWPIKGPVQVRPGDTVIFGTPAGPRFIVWVDPMHYKSSGQILNEAKAKGGDQGAMLALGSAVDRVFGAPSSGGIAGEIQRRAQAELLTTGAGSTAYNAVRKARTGALTNPRNLVAAGVAVLGLLGTGSITCSGVLWAVYRAMMQ